MKRLKLTSILLLVVFILATLPTQLLANNTPITLQQIVDKINESDYGAFISNLIMENPDISNGLSEPIVMDIQAEVQGNRILLTGSIGLESNPDQIEVTQYGPTIELRGNILYLSVDFTENSNGLEDNNGLNEYARIEFVERMHVGCSC